MKNIFLSLPLCILVIKYHKIFCYPLCLFQHNVKWLKGHIKFIFYLNNFYLFLQYLSKAFLIASVLIPYFSLNSSELYKSVPLQYIMNTMYSCTHVILTCYCWLFPNDCEIISSLLTIKDNYLYSRTMIAFSVHP